LARPAFQSCVRMPLDFCDAGVRGMDEVCAVGIPWEEAEVHLHL